MAESCGNCRFFSALKELCRKNPPIPFPSQDSRGQIIGLGMFPPVKSDNWCGAYEPSPKPESVERIVT